MNEHILIALTRIKGKHRIKAVGFNRLEYLQKGGGNLLGLSGERSRVFQLPFAQKTFSSHPLRTWSSTHYNLML